MSTTSVSRQPLGVTIAPSPELLSPSLASSPNLSGLRIGQGIMYIHSSAPGSSWRGRDKHLDASTAVLMLMRQRTHALMTLHSSPSNNNLGISTASNFTRYDLDERSPVCFLAYIRMNMVHCSGTIAVVIFEPPETHIREYQQAKTCDV